MVQPADGASLSQTTGSADQQFPQRTLDGDIGCTNYHPAPDRVVFWTPIAGVICGQPADYPGTGATADCRRGRNIDGLCRTGDRADTVLVRYAAAELDNQ